jgi:dUTPase
MALIVNKIISQKWFKYEGDVEFLIRPFAASMFLEKISVEEDSGKEMNIADQFLYCVIDWKGIIDKETKKKLVVNNDNKKFLYDYSPDIIAFVFNKIAKLNETIIKKENKEIKN